MYYFCKVCETKCDTKQNFDIHIATTKHLINVKNNTPPPPPPTKSEYVCTICKKIYVKLGHLTNHITKCKSNICSNLISSGIPENDVANVLATIDAKLNLIPQESKQICNNNIISTQTAQNIQNANTIHNTQNHTTQNIYITPFGKEDISMISDEKQRGIIEHEKRAFEFLLMELYKHKTNYNIFISDKRNGIVKYLTDDNTLQVVQLDYILDEMNENHKKILNNFIDKFGESFKGGVPKRLLDLRDDHECGERDEKYKKLSKRKLFEISEEAKTLLQKIKNN